MATKTMTNDIIIKKVQSQLQKHAKNSTKKKYEQYFKQQISYRGLKAPETDSILASFNDSLPQENLQLLELGLQFLQQNYAEDKLIGNRILKKGIRKEVFNSDPDERKKFLDKIEGLFDDGHVQEWGTCDGICGHALSNLMKCLQGDDRVECARSICKWCKSGNIWKQRASGVSFVTVARHGDDFLEGLHDLIFQTCDVTLQSEERFVQLGSRWCLRELGKGDQNALLQYVHKILRLFSREGLRYALEKTNKEKYALLMDQHKQLKINNNKRKREE
eukprot:TRINITY_DN36785_c1_g1_i1.p3 TRINITY_DN36785_c1_g1~~TRINITY_DN36785_c1_g1_i1.p3  ORF type:complete len:276 (+),score=39.23 TRINITY_DN36785_c1_g1_i1:69-896(+)